jgi:glutamate N-acetyltransferase/amino-acid N-acetyltransferase
MRIPGFRAAGVACGIKRAGEPDLALILCDRPATVAGVFTTNRFPGAAVRLSRRRARRGAARAVLVNSGIANVATGAAGVAAARALTRAAAGALGLAPSEVLMSSTGVIGRPLPVERIRAALPEVVRKLSATGWSAAARAIRTTDTRIKLAHRAPSGFSLGGIAKGAGMTMPKMATMLAYLATDLAVEPAFLREALSEAVGRTFNAFTIDGEMSTSDTVLLSRERWRGGHAARGRDRHRGAARARRGAGRPVRRELGARQDGPLRRGSELGAGHPGGGRRGDSVAAGAHRSPDRRGRALATRRAGGR